MWRLVAVVLVVLAVVFFGITMLTAHPVCPSGHQVVTTASSTLTSKGLIAVSYKDNNGKRQILTVSQDGKERCQLTHGSLDTIMPSWSPDGTHIAYMAHGNDQIRLMNADGSNDLALTDYASDGSVVNATPRWSPDGTKIAYTSGVRTSPDIVVWPNTHIWVMNADGSGKKQLTRGDFADLGPTWSPDGKTIAFSSSRSGGVFHIWKMRADGTNAVAITTSGTDAVSGYPIEQKVPMYSPNGAYIVYWEGVEESHLSRDALMGKAGPTAADRQIAGTWHIHIMNADGSGARTLIGGDDPAWSPDSRMVLFPGGDNNSLPPGVAAINVDGTDPHLLFTTGPGPFGFSWQPLP